VYFGATTVAALTTRLRTERLDEQTLSADGGEARPLFVKATAATPAPESCTDDILVCPLNNDYLRGWSLGQGRALESGCRVREARESDHLTSGAVGRGEEIKPMREQSKSAAEPELPSPSLSPESPRSGAP